MTDQPSNRSTLRSYDRDQRLAWIESNLGKYTTRQLARRTHERFGVSERQAYDDIAEIVERCRADDAKDSQDRIAAARREWLRKTRLYEAKGRYADANYAYDKYCKLLGLYAPKKVQLSGHLTVGAQITSLVGVLDARGLAALEIVQEQIAAAKAKGLLPEKTDATPVPIADEDDDYPEPERGE